MTNPARHRLATLALATSLLATVSTAQAQSFPVQGAVPDGNRVLYEKNRSTEDRANFQALAPFFRDLARLESGQMAQMNVLQIGDSHTANNYFSGRLRLLLQQRFGNAGRGVMPPGIPFLGVDHRQMHFSQDKAWLVENSLKSPNQGPYGLSGFAVKSKGAGAHMGLSANTPDDWFDWVTVDYLKHAKGGKFQVYLDGTLAATVSTIGPDGHTGHLVLQAPSRLSRLDVVARSANIGLTSWSAGRKNHGLVLSSHGVVGSTVDIVNRWSPTIVESEIANLRPSLIIMAYGTNEGFDGEFKSGLYAQNFVKAVTLVRKSAPNAAILIVGPPDSQKSSNGYWGAPPALAEVRAIQREAARQLGAAFWDWSSVMPEGMATWVDQGLARPDHVHFAGQGYEIAGDKLFDWLMTGFEAARKLVPRRG